MIRDSNPDFRIDSDAGVHRITPKMYWIRSLVGVSHFAEFREKRPVNVSEMLIHFLKNSLPYSAYSAIVSEVGK